MSPISSDLLWIFLQLLTLSHFLNVHVLLTSQSLLSIDITSGFEVFWAASVLLPTAETICLGVVFFSLCSISGSALLNNLISCRLLLGIPCVRTNDLSNAQLSYSNPELGMFLLCTLRLTPRIVCFPSTFGHGHFSCVSKCS